ncbi:hypothetical protein [Niallia endozanthoxylica]|uniref:Uncharacterized protein n=1 Tax=Niallia endozanthoxylica TaxID=2036016 RepID=A0A5J5HNP1_9BACI|nr:hypothetical protein [Niallia endozanthoxylica]KAA9022949.1 hypothetical protein F4V44_14540 [Niallia endozanthoxylica]
MLTYDEITKKLLTQMRNVGLNPYNIKHNIEIQTLYKEFTCNCALLEKNLPHISRVEIGFGWDSSLTANSMYGSDCSLYHDDTMECIHDDLDADVWIELNIKYNIEVEKEYENETNTIYSELMKLFTDNMNHENIPHLKWNVMVNHAGQTLISSIDAKHYWEIPVSENKEDFDYVLGDIFNEVKNNLQSIDALPFIKRKY